MKTITVIINTIGIAMVLYGILFLDVADNQTYNRLVGVGMGIILTSSFLSIFYLIKKP